MGNVKTPDLRIRKAALGAAGVILAAYVFCLPKELFDVPCATVVTDRRGELLGARIASDGQWRFPTADTIPEKYAKCLIAFEDRRFYRHWGVDPGALGRAMWQNIRVGRVVSGGSTITMQTIRLSRRRKRTVGEKLLEIILATRMEFRYTKERILALYASHAPFGGNVVGIDAAAWRYFGHSPQQLSWAEAAMLAVLPNAPASIHPARNRETLLLKRNRLLRRICQQNIIDSTTCELALSEDLPSEPLPLPQIAPHLVSHIHRIRPGKLTVSSIDASVQRRVEAVLERRHREFVRSDIRNLAALVIDVRTNRALAYCGNVDFHLQKHGNQVDVIRSPRSTGSILKPFLYCAALQEGEMLPDMLLPDVPMNINGFMPQNFNRQFDGAVPASQAVARSLNVPFVMLLRRYGVPKFYDFLKNADISTLHQPSSHYGLSLILGGAEATLWDVTSAYTDMARSLEGLQRTSCSLLERVGEECPETPVFHPAAVWQTFNAIKEVNRPEEIDWRTISSMQTVAWKTGTSFGFRDAWAVGITPRYAVGVWVGNASGEGKPELTGARTAAPVMFDLLNLLPVSVWFEPPADEGTEVEVCRHSGHLKGRFCDETKTVTVCPAGLKTAACPYHMRVVLSADERFRVYTHCAGNGETVSRNCFVLPPAWEWFYKARHIEYRTLPPFRPDCGGGDEMPMQFIYPQGNTRVVLPRQLDGSPGEITFELAHSRNGATVFWHVDEEYVVATRDFHKLTIHLLPGHHTLTAVDNEGHTLALQVEVSH
jgi:penicillin-binding protein 1C